MLSRCRRIYPMVQLFLYVAYGAAGLCLLLQSVYMCGRLCAGCIAVWVSKNERMCDQFAGGCERYVLLCARCARLCCGEVRAFMCACAEDCACAEEYRVCVCSALLRTVAHECSRARVYAWSACQVAREHAWSAKSPTHSRRRTH